MTAVYATAYRAALAVTRAEEADERDAKDRAAAIAGTISAAVNAGDAPGAWFTSAARQRAANIAAVEAVSR